MLAMLNHPEHISIPHSPINPSLGAAADVAFNAFQFHTVRLIRGWGRAAAGFLNHFNSTQSD